MKMASEHDCGNEDTPQNSVNLMNIVREPPNIHTRSVVKFLITKSQFLQYNLILAMLQLLLLLENVSDPESVKSLDTSSQPSPLQQLQHKRKLNVTQKLILLLFLRLFLTKS